MPARESAENQAVPSFVKDFKALVAKNIKGNMQLVSRVNELVRNAGTSLGPQRLKNEGRQPARLLRLLEFNLASYEIMSTCTLEMLNGLVSAAENSLFGQEAAAAASVAAAPRKVGGEIRVEVRPGELLKAPFVVENQYRTPLDISFEASDLIAAAAPALPAATIAFAPPALRLEPQRKAVVSALVTISKAFVVGQTYASTIRVLGFQGQEVRLVLTILPPAARARAAKPGKPAARKAANKRARP